MLSDELERSAFEAHIRSTWRVPADYLDWALKVKDGAYQDSRAQDQWSGWLSKARAIEREATAPLIEQIKGDAERYRWLRDIGDETWPPFSKRAGCSGPLIDAAIDAAIRASKGEA